ncbi:MAG: DUF664 domain-containing protein [Propioniciclava sp.]|nr:DUF664 domain-containing protein [Propioniciclava sp.]
MEFIDTNLDGARFERVSMRGATLHRVRLDEARLSRMVLTGAEIRGAGFYGTRLVGVELNDVTIDGDIENVVINGVDIGPLIAAELTRRDPLYGELNPTDAEGFRRAWAQIEQRWDDLTERARALPEDTLHASVDREWSFIQTLRHLGFATAAWLQRTVQGDPHPYLPLDLPWDEAPDWPAEWDMPLDRDARPSLDEALAGRTARQRAMREHLATLTDADLEGTVTRPEPGWPAYPDTPVLIALQTILVEEYHHHRFATRDLDALTTPQKEN